MEKAISRAKNQTERTGEKIDFYQCRYCRFWHTGHNKETKGDSAKVFRTGKEIGALSFENLEKAIQTAKDSYPKVGDRLYQPPHGDN